MAPPKGSRWSKYASPAARSLFNKMRGYGLQIDYELFLSLTSSPCHYCGSPPKNVRRYRDHEPYVYSGLDRQDPNGGYVADNIVPCCWKCNKMKSNMTAEQFLEHISGILLRLNNGKATKDSGGEGPA